MDKLELLKIKRRICYAYWGDLVSVSCGWHEDQDYQLEDCCGVYWFEYGGFEVDSSNHVEATFGWANWDECFECTFENVEDDLEGFINDHDLLFKDATFLMNEKANRRIKEEQTIMETVNGNNEI